MSKIKWDQPGEKLYETGVREGILYPMAAGGTYPKGVAWNGLTTVTESPSGAEVTPLYADDIKYLNLISAEEFGGTIEAYMYPDEFGACDGSAILTDGVAVGQQNRQTFGLCYKTVLGNDADDNDYGYKLHLIYGALASPSEKNYATINDNPEAITFSWEFTTTPVAVAKIGDKTFKPTSCITIDSTKVTDMTKLDALLEILQGKDPTAEIGIDGVDPRLPLPNEVASIMGVASGGGEEDPTLVLDEYIIMVMIIKYGATEAMKKFIQLKRSASLTKLVGRFYEAAAKIETRKFTSQFYKYTTSPSSIGTKLDDNEDMVCTPSTISTPGTDDYAEIPLFACFDVNYTIDADTLEPVIHAIRGISEDFSYAPSESFVGVMQMTGYYRRTTTETTKTVEYQANPAEGFKPLPEAVRASDNTVRPFVIHAKYAAGYNSLGLLSSVSGVQPATLRSGSSGSTSISHDGQIAKWREWGSQYGGSALCDIAFLQIMLEIKYAVLGSAQVMGGCRSYASGFTVAAAEDGVTRVLLSSTDAAKLVVGGCVSVGIENDRGNDACYSICDIVPILSIEDVEVEGVAYKAVNLDTETTFNVPVGAYVVAQPWRTGATDDVPGNDGSPFDNTSGKEPYKLQGIEVQLGIAEVPGDTTLNETATADDASGVYNIYTNRLAANVRSGGSGVDPVMVGTITKNGSSAEWKYVAELNWDANDQEAYLAAQAYGAAYNTGYRGAHYLDAEATAGWCEWRAFGRLVDGGLCGFVCVTLVGGLAAANWGVGARACGTAGNRGHIS